MKKNTLLGCAALVLLLAGCGESDGTSELEKGWAAYERHDLKKADKLFTKSVAVNGANVDALVASARIKLELGELKAAREVLARAVERAGDDADVVLLGAQLAYHAKDYTMSSRLFSDFANDPSRASAQRSEAFVGLAVVEMTCNHREEARVALLKALVLDRRSVVAHYHLGKLYRDEFREAALEEFRTYVLLESANDARVQRVQRQVIPALQDEIARKAASRPGVSQRNSAASAAKLQQAEAEARRGNVTKAKAAYAEAFRADPLSFEAAKGLAETCAKTEKGKSEALKYYKEACSLKPSSIKTLLTTAKLAASLGNVATAAAAYSRALAANPKSIDAIDGHIRALRKTEPKLAAQWQSYRDMLKK